MASCGLLVPPQLTSLHQPGLPGPSSPGTLAALRARNEPPSRSAAQGPMGGRAARPKSLIPRRSTSPGHAARYLRLAELYHDGLTRAAIALPGARRAQGGPPARGLRRAVHPARRCSRLARCNHWYYGCRGRVMTGVFYTVLYFLRRSSCCSTPTSSNICAGPRPVTKGNRACTRRLHDSMPLSSWTGLRVSS